jgi:hypothetical protein
MYTFRYNPVHNQWVILGSPFPTHHLEIQDANLLDVGKNDRLMAASFPNQPFVLEPPAEKSYRLEKGLLFGSEPPVGEYELLLYKGPEHLLSWDARQWTEWLSLLQHRLRLFHHNPHLHFIQCSLSSSLTQTTQPSQRVGDLWASRLALGEEPPLLTEDLVEKLGEKEVLFFVLQDELGSLYVPSAPLFEKEAWYIPADYKSGMENMTENEKSHLAGILATLLTGLKLKYTHQHFGLRVHTSLGENQKSTWWIQVYQEPTLAQPLPLRDLPEKFVLELGDLFRS